MLTTLIIAGFLGMLAPWLGFMTLFVGGMFVLSTAAGFISIAVVVMLVLILFLAMAVK